jgi:hypothetical protein
MRAVVMLIAAVTLAAPAARADAALEARVLRLEAQVRALQDSLKSALAVDRVYSIKAAGAPDSCLSSGPDAGTGKSEVFISKCGSPDARSWKLQPAQP